MANLRIPHGDVSVDENHSHTHKNVPWAGGKRSELCTDPSPSGHAVRSDVTRGRFCGEIQWIYPHKCPPVSGCKSGCHMGDAYVDESSPHAHKSVPPWSGQTPEFHAGTLMLMRTVPTST